MKQFVIIFHQSRQLSEDEIRVRAQETGVWARRQNADGHKLDPRILNPEGRWGDQTGIGGSTPTIKAGPITALLFLETSNLDEAMGIAMQHPGVRFGASVEVRPWAPPAPVS